MAGTPLNDTDCEFLGQMLQHHRAGIEMIDTYLSSKDTAGRQPRVFDMAETMQDQMSKQANQMEKILKDAGEPVPPADSGGAEMKTRSSR